MRRAFAVHGHVQGVGFRWFVQRRAAANRLAGWVRNEPDGSVTGEVEGGDVDVAAFFEALRQGPPRAKVERVEEVDLPPAGITGFSIR